MNIFQNTSKEVANNTNKGDIMNAYDLLNETEGTKVFEFDLQIDQLEKMLEKNCQALFSSEENSETLEAGVEKMYPVYTIKVPEKIILSGPVKCLCMDLSISDGVIQKHDDIYEISTDLGVKVWHHNPKINFSLDISNGMNSSKMILDRTNQSFEGSKHAGDVDVSNMSYDLSIGDIQLTDKCMSVIDTFADFAEMSVYLLDFKYKKVITVEDDMYYLHNGEKHLAKRGDIFVLNDLDKMEGYLITQDNLVLYKYLYKTITNDYTSD